MLVYKIATAESWRDAGARGAFHGSADDQRDGFIHLSTAEQVRGTADKHFTGQSDLVIAALNANQLGDALKWETSRGGAQFPHYYGALPIAAVAWTRPLLLGTDGRHVVPEEVV